MAEPLSEQQMHTDARRARRALMVVLAVYAIIGAGFALRTPAWQAPDEPAHYNYIAQVAANGCCPVIEAGDWDQAYLEQLTASHFAPDQLGNLTDLEYEDHQPPLYYLINAPVFALTNGSLTALRLVSVLIGAGVVLCAFAIGRVMLPSRPQIALGAAVFAAFLPQHAAMLASVNNDGLSELIVGLTLWASLDYWRGGNTRAWLLGSLVGLGLLTKVNTLFLVGLVPLVLLARWRVERGSIAALARTLALFALPALLIGGMWLARNVSVYGMPDVFGLGAHNAVVVGQPRTADLIAQVGFGEYLRRGAETTFQSFWGQFGWMALPLPGWTYTLIALLVVVVIVGLLVDVLVLRGRDPGNGMRVGWWVLALTVALAAAQYAYYNTEFQQFQGRYLYPALIPLAVWTAVGLDAWRRWLGSGHGWAQWAAVAVLALLIPLDAYLLWRVIPGLAG